MVSRFFNTRALTLNPSAIVMNIAGKTLTYGEQRKRAASLVAWCKQHSVAVGQPVLVAVRDEFESASLLLALISIGRPPLILDPDSTAFEMAKVLSFSQYHAVIAEQTVLDHWEFKPEGVPLLQVAKPKASAGVFGKLLGKRAAPEGGPTWPNLPAAEILEGDFLPKPNSLAYVVFTSGTTSAPKGVELEQGALLSQMQALQIQYQLDENSQILNTLPLHHADGLLQGPLLAWFCGVTVYRPMAFSAQYLEQYLDSLYSYRISHLIAVPTMLALIHRLGGEWKENFDNPDLRFVVSCAGHLERDLWESFEEDFQVRVVNMYGLSETGTSALFSGPDEATRRVGTIGKPVNSEIRICNELGQPASRGEAGELWIASDQLMRGYHNNPVDTSQVLQDGWLRTGDLVRELDAGHIEVTGRKKNQIVSGGRNISPQELAETLNGHPAVIESVVLGQYDPDWGDVAIALVVTQEVGLTEAELVRWCRDRLTEYKVPRHIYFVDTLVKGPSGKIRLELAHQQLEQISAAEQEVSEGNQSTKTQAHQIAAAVFRISITDVSDTSTPENTPGWDSLAHMTFIIELERGFNITLSTRDIMQIDSIGRAVAVCEAKRTQ
ncbi:MAG: AMP-binding protein [Pseudomonadales bacterium]